MPLTAREAFKVGFMLRCADEGLTPAQAQERIEKAAGFFKESTRFLEPVVQAVKPLSTVAETVEANKPVSKFLTNILWGAPLAVGAAGGYAAHKLTANDIDEEDVRKQELIDELRHWTRRAREQQKARKTLLTPA